ncbi:SDR family NAD(P)-dependent oxidoreductase [Ideonella livida]|uniref:SDR family NAD(P)-dependent oxidoreductase n=1 Tax=Ideonella livida TaxID=2707176 RepID=A0A7C9PGP5_9BURK|nr:SDR family NAD(P)-dependent oxidoreductase [Ideonella livida]NDY91229.1 SDR family NAD(P)-dependent oxidoreductase [Ideonella livida]
MPFSVSDAWPPLTAAPPVALITGANTGIGRITALELARQGWRVVLAGRSLARTQAVLDDIRLLPGAPAGIFLSLDLGDFESVRRCAAHFQALGLPLHLLINNAGVAGRRGLTASGFELAFGVNHMGHFLLTRLLLPHLLTSTPARVVTVASAAHRHVRGLPDWERLRRRTRSPLGLPEYAVSKLANILFSAQLARELAGSGVSTYAVHPGVVATEIWRHAPGPVQWLLRHFARMVTPEEGARTPLRCATDPALSAQTGLYWRDGQAQLPCPAARDEATARALWDWSLAQLGETPPNS